LGYQFDYKSVSLAAFRQQPLLEKLLMTTSKKYELELSETADGWLAKITRKVSYKKRLTTKEQGGFESESSAKLWAESTLEELTSKQRSSNNVQSDKRKKNEEIKLLRSERRASKTQKAKADAAAPKGKTERLEEI